MIRQKQQKKSSTLDSFQGQELTTLEKAKITGGFLNLFGIYHIHGMFDGEKNNTKGHWSWNH